MTMPPTADRLRPIDHLIACNRHDPARYLPLVVDGATVGLVRRDHARRLVDAGSIFVTANGDASALSLAPALDRAGAAERTAAIAGVVDGLSAAGDLPPRRGEDYAATAGWGAPIAFRVDRAHVPVLGIRAYGQHVNGLVDDPAGVAVWIGVRALDRAVAPGRLDNMVAGGLPVGLDLATNLAKEGEEEAGLDAAVMASARPVGVIRYRLDVAAGLRDDVLFVYDLWLDAGVTPVNRDGEVARFDRWRLADVLPALARPDAFKFNVPLVLVHLLIRQGVVAPDDPDYPALAGGLGGLPAWEAPSRGRAPGAGEMPGDADGGAIAASPSS